MNIIKNNPHYKSFMSTLKVCAKHGMTGGPLKVFMNRWFDFLWFMFMVAIWYSVGSRSQVYGMSMENLFTYSLMSTAFRKQFDIITPATSALWEGSVIGRYTRPMHIFSSYIAETIGRYWVPTFLCYTVPMIIFMPMTFGFSASPISFLNGALAFISLCLSASLGFALDFIFSGIAIRMKNACWAVNHIRETFITLVSGAFIPFSLLPKPLGTTLALLPFGSIASAPLNIYIGKGSAPNYIFLQIFWNIILWISAVFFYKKSEERMISFGG